MTDAEARRIIESTAAALDKISSTYLEALTGLWKRAEKNPSDADAVFWAWCKTEKTLGAPMFKERIIRAATECDVGFFKKLGGDLNRKRPQLPMTELLLALFWKELPMYGHGLCVCSDKAIMEFFNFSFKSSHSLESMRKLRQRLGLIKPKRILYRRFAVRGELCGFE